MLDHPVGILVARHTALPQHRGTNVSENVHASCVHPNKERFARLDLTAHEIDCRRSRLVVNRLHALAGEWAGVLTGLFAYKPPVRLYGRIFRGERLTTHHT